MAGLIKTVLAVEAWRDSPQLAFRAARTRASLSTGRRSSSTRPSAPFDPGAGAAPRRRQLGGDGRHERVRRCRGGSAAAPAPSAHAPDVHLERLRARPRRRSPPRSYPARGAGAPGDAPDLRDACFTANRGRHHFDHRFSAVGPDRDDRAGRTRSLLGWRPQSCAERGGRAAASRSSFLFSGQGAQYARMGESVYRAEPSVPGHARSMPRDVRGGRHPGRGRPVRRRRASPPPDALRPARPLLARRSPCRGSGASGGSSPTWSSGTASASSPPRSPPACALSRTRCASWPRERA